MSNKLVPTTYIKETLKLKVDIQGAFLQLGERFYNIKEEELWQGQYNSFSEFLQHMEISDGHASKLVQIYARFVLEYGISQMKLSKIGIQKLYVIMPMCTDKKSLQSALDQIEGLSSSDVKQLVLEEEAGPHKHQDEEYVRCTVCKRVKRIYDKEEK